MITQTLESTWLIPPAPALPISPNYGDTEISHRPDEADPEAPWRWGEQHLDRVTALLRRRLDAEGILGESARYHMAPGGKQLRARLALAACHCYGVGLDSAVHAAAACELLHNASLIHDDLQDKDVMRRGRPTVWYRFGPEVAINLGDYFIVLAYALLADAPCPTLQRTNLVAAFSRAVANTIKGQLNELSLQGCPDTALEAYEMTAKAKSGALFALPVECALLLAEAPAEHLEHAREALQAFGLTYQINDDLSDVLGIKEGRTAGSDLRARKLTAPVLFYLKHAAPDERGEFERFLRSQPSPMEDNLEPLWLDRIRRSDALEDCRRHLKRVQIAITRHLNRLPRKFSHCLEHGLNPAAKPTTTKVIPHEPTRR